MRGDEVSDSEQTVGERLDLVRRREGLSQEAFAQLLGVSRSSLKYYIGDERDITASVLATLLEKLSVDPSWMISGDVSEAAMKQWRLVKLTQGEFPIHIARRHIIAVKPDLNGATKIVTTGQETSSGASYAAFIVNESIEEVVAAIEADSNKS